MQHLPSEDEPWGALPALFAIAPAQLPSVETLVEDPSVETPCAMRWEVPVDYCSGASSDGGGGGGAGKCVESFARACERDPPLALAFRTACALWQLPPAYAVWLQARVRRCVLGPGDVVVEEVRDTTAASVPARSPCLPPTSGGWSRLGDTQGPGVFQASRLLA
jgi:hypothetical protein